MATIENISATEDSSSGWKVYYLKILADGEEFYKVGVCGGSVKKRFSKEPAKTVIKILKIWTHDSESKAYQHEENFFKDYPGDRPYIGRCGPLRFGGNTEIYSHDVVGGQPPPESYIVRMHSINSMPLYTIGYPEENPKSAYSHLEGKVRYMDYAFGPLMVDGEGVFLQVPLLSHPSTVTIATDFLLHSIASGDISPR